MNVIWDAKPITDEATIEVAFLFENADVKAEILRILRILCSQKDPRNPKPDTNLIVDELEFDAPSWFRVKVPRYGIRIIFRILIIRDDAIIQIKTSEPIPDEVEERYLEIMQAGYRKDVYGEELRKRYRKYNQAKD